MFRNTFALTLLVEPVFTFVTRNAALRQLQEQEGTLPTVPLHRARDGGIQEPHESIVGGGGRRRRRLLAHHHHPPTLLLRCCVLLLLREELAQAVLRTRRIARDLFPVAGKGAGHVPHRRRRALERDERVVGRRRRRRRRRAVPGGGGGGGGGLVVVVVVVVVTTTAAATATASRPLAPHQVDETHRGSSHNRGGVRQRQQAVQKYTRQRIIPAERSRAAEPSSSSSSSTYTTTTAPRSSIATAHLRTVAFACFGDRG